MPVHYETPTTYTDAEMLAFVRQAIVEVTACGQSHALPGGRQWLGANLGELRGMERDYLNRVDSASNGRVVNYVRFSN